MTMPAIQRVAILGGGTAGWIAAAALARVFARRVAITLVESPDLPIVGVGEATIPAILDFLRFLGIDEADFIAGTSGTYKTGIVFQDWAEPGSRYWHPFGTFGGAINGRPFYHAWHRARAAGRPCRVPDHSVAAALGEACRLIRPEAGERDPLRAGFRTALHFDATLVGQYLRRLAVRLGVTRVQATVTGAGRAEDGRLSHLALADGRHIEADLFLDCSGFRSALLGEALGVPYQDWRHWLPCDRALAAPSAIAPPTPPYTLSVAHAAGWRWRIPLQHRFGNGVVYSSAFMGDDEAHDVLRAGVGELLDEPRRLSFVTGRRDVFWQGNCVGLGLAAGFLEPLESTSIQLVIDGVTKLIDHFPDQGFGPRNVAAYNRAMADEYDAVRDFIILHYCLTPRRDTAFWRHCAAIELPPGLAERIALYRETGRIVPRASEMFTDLSWFYVLDGMGVVPHAYDPVIDLPSESDLFGVMDQVRHGVARIVASAPVHDGFLGSASLPDAPARRALAGSRAQ